MADIIRNGETIQQALRLIASALGLEATFTTIEPPFQIKMCNPEQREDMIRKQRRSDLRWLAQVGAAHFPQYEGNYIAIFDKKVFGSGPKEKVVRVGAAEKLEVKPEDILIVPISVRDADAQDIWDTANMDVEQ